MSCRFSRSARDLVSPGREPSGEWKDATSGLSSSDWTLRSNSLTTGWVCCLLVLYHAVSEVLDARPGVGSEAERARGVSASRRGGGGGGGGAGGVVADQVRAAHLADAVNWKLGPLSCSRTRTLSSFSSFSSGPCVPMILLR